MPRRSALLSIAWGACLGLACGAADEPAPAPEAPPRPPNIVMVLSDDLRADALGIAGHPFVRTPHIDRLAEQGVRFDHAFVVTAVCGPSRASLLTGLYPQRSGVTTNGIDLDYARVATLPMLLHQAGYATAFFGKYHLGADAKPRPGFDRWEGFRGGGGSGRYVDVKLDVDGESVTSEGYSTDVITDHAVAWIHEQGDRPFFLLLSPKNVHVPVTPPPRHAKLYSDAKIRLPASVDDPPSALPMHIQHRLTTNKLTRRIWDGAADPKSALVEFIRDYARSVPSLDESVGRLDATLHELGLVDDTIFVFTSDNGFLLGEHGLVRKGLAYEPSIRVPLVIRYPRVAAGGVRREEPALNVDVPVTLLALAGVAAPAGVDGRSLAPLMRGESPAWREDWLYVGKHAPGKRPELLALRTERWKYVRYALGPVEEQLFDLSRDPEERHDLTRDRGAAGTLERMRERMRLALAAQDAPASWWTSPAGGGAAIRPTPQAARG